MLKKGGVRTELHYVSKKAIIINIKYKEEGNS
jgi:hypothetical protein